MRFLGILGISAALVGLSACSDDSGDAVVSDKVSWKLGCASATGCGVHASHTQATTKQKFKASCQRGATGLNATIEDPGYKGDPTGGVAGSMRPGSIIEIHNADPTLNRCNVTVKDTDTYGGFWVSYGGTCGTECTFQGQFGYMGWDFSGTLICNSLTAVGSGALAQTKFTLTDAVNVGSPVQIDLDNCSH
jgi:hypothetical protein